MTPASQLITDAIDHAVRVVEHRTGLTVHPLARLNRCCHVDDGGASCGLPAAYQVRERGTTWEGTAADDTYACAAHLEAMMGYGGDPVPGRVIQYLVTPLDGPDAR